jgi:GNAT superfamily N-acetyltransferase
MTHPSFLRPATGGPPFDLEPCGPDDHSEFARLHAEIGRAHYWTDRDEWDVARWQEWLGRPELHARKIVVDGRAAGIIELAVHEDDLEIELETFGLIPSVIGTGLGGAALTRATVLGWELGGADTRRVRLSTNSLDHPRALPNYLARGYRIYREEQSSREIPDDIPEHHS